MTSYEHGKAFLIYNKLSAIASRRCIHHCLYTPFSLKLYAAFQMWFKFWMLIRPDLFFKETICFLCETAFNVYGKDRGKRFGSIFTIFLMSCFPTCRGGMYTANIVFSSFEPVNYYESKIKNFFDHMTPPFVLIEGFIICIQSDSFNIRKTGGVIW